MDIQKLVFLFLPVIIKPFNFNDSNKVKFIDLITNNKKKMFSKKTDELEKISLDEYNSINRQDLYKNQIADLLKNDTGHETLVLINFPRNISQLDEIKSLINEKEIDIKAILVHVANFELIIELQKDYIICPICEILLEKKTTIIGDKFVCSNIKHKEEINLFDLDEMNKVLMNNYLENNHFVVDALSRLISKNNIVQLTIENKNVIFNDLLDKILNLIKS